MTTESLEIDYQNLVASVLDEIEKQAKQILRSHSSLNEFIMAMGTCFFTTKTDTISLYDRPYMSELNKFINRWDDRLKICGDPMRVSATGERITDW